MADAAAAKVERRHQGLSGARPIIFTPSAGAGAGAAYGPCGQWHDARMRHRWQVRDTAAAARAAAGSCLSSRRPVREVPLEEDTPVSSAARALQSQHAILKRDPVSQLAALLSSRPRTMAKLWRSLCSTAALLGKASAQVLLELKRRVCCG